MPNPQSVSVAPTIASPPERYKTAFWLLMARWGVSDSQALRLMEVTPSPIGSRPLLSMTTADQVERLELLLAIDQLASDLYRGNVSGWILSPNGSTIFGRRSPIGYMARDGRNGMEDVLRHLQEVEQGAVLGNKTKRTRRNGPGSSMPI